MRSRAFSLVEVVIAVGIFAVAVAGMLALVPLLSRQATDTVDLMAAQRLPDAIRIEMDRLATGRFDAFAMGVPVLGSSPDGFRMIATRDGARIGVAGENGGAVDLAEGFFLVELWRFDNGPLVFNGGVSGTLAVEVRVSWPLLNAGDATPHRQRFVFATAINR